MLFYDLFSACRVNHGWCEQNKSLKWSFNYICWDEYLKYVIDGKVDMKLSVMAREKNDFLRQKIFGPIFCLQTVCKIQWEGFRF